MHHLLFLSPIKLLLGDGGACMCVTILSSSSFTGQDSSLFFFFFELCMSVVVPPSIFPEGVLDGLLSFSFSSPPAHYSAPLPESQTGEYFTPSADADRLTLKGGKPLIHQWQISEMRGESEEGKKGHLIQKV